MTDVRFAIRSLRKSPGFTTVAILTLALGIGANTAILSLVHSVILKPLPYRDPARVVVAWDTYLPNVERIGVSITEYQALHEQTDLFQQTAWYGAVPTDLALTAPDAEALQVHTSFASPNCLRSLAPHRQWAGSSPITKRRVRPCSAIRSGSHASAGTGPFLGGRFG
jgi:hypothetical protein